MGVQWAEHTIEIEATPDEVFDAITDYETFPAWQSAVIATEVTENDKSGLGEVVKYEVDGKVRKIRYTLRYHYDRPERISWDFIEGQGINSLEGGYEIRASGEGASATYKVGIDVTGVPGPILKRAHRSTIKKANEDLKAEAKRRARAGDPGQAEHEAEEPSPAGAPRYAPPEEPEQDKSPIPFDMLPEPLDELARLPGKIMVAIGKRLGG